MDLINFLLRQDWHIDRKINDNLTGDILFFTGSAIFKRHSECFKYTEHGKLIVDKNINYKATRSYKYFVRADNKIECTFEDDRTFYVLDMKSYPHFCVEHSCGNDLYHGIIKISDKSWNTNWVIKGPNKSMQIETNYR